MTAITPAYAHAYQATCLSLDTCLQSPTKSSAYQSSKPDIRIFPMLVPLHVTGAMISVDGLFIQMGELASLMVKFLLDEVLFHDPMDELMLCLVPSSPPRLISLSLEPKHNPNTAEMTAMIEALSFLGPHGPVARDEQSCIYYESQHAAGVCLGTIQARTHVQLALARQKSMILAQRKLRITMQHVYGHNGNLGNECADHAAALGTLGFTSSHNVTTHWIHHNFDATACFDYCHIITEILERLQRIRADTVSHSQHRI